MKEAIIELPAEFTPPNDAPIFVTPPALAGKEHHVRHLVLDIKLDLRDGAVQTQLNRASKGMRLMSSRLPNLESFVASLLIGNRKHESRAKSFGAEMLNIRNRVTWKMIETLRTSLVEFCHVLRARGPGRRKFIRFLEQGEDLPTGRLFAGPMVRLPIYVAPKKEDRPSEASASDEESESPTVEERMLAEQVLEQAYRYHHVIASQRANRAGVNETQSLLSQSRRGGS